MNPALAGRVFVLICFPQAMSSSLSVPAQLNGALFRMTSDAFSGATPLMQTPAEFLIKGTYWDLFLGTVPGCIGEVSAVLLIIGAVYLFIKQIITWDIPITFLGSFSLLVWIFGGSTAPFTGNVLYHLLSGGLLLGCFYMATDPVRMRIINLFVAFLRKLPRRSGFCDCFYEHVRTSL